MGPQRKLSARVGALEEVYLGVVCELAGLEEGNSYVSVTFENIALVADVTLNRELTVS